MITKTFTANEFIDWLQKQRGVSGLTAAQSIAAEDWDRVRYLWVSSQSPGVKRPPGWTLLENDTSERYLSRAVPPEDPVFEAELAARFDRVWSDDDD